MASPQLVSDEDSLNQSRLTGFDDVDSDNDDNDNNHDTDDSNKALMKLKLELSSSHLVKNPFVLFIFKRSMLILNR